MRRLDSRAVTSTLLIIHEGTGQPYNAHTFRHDFADIRALVAAKWPAFFQDDGSLLAMSDLHFRHLRHTAITELAAAGATVPQIAAISGHTVGSVEQILERYLVRTSTLADEAIGKRLRRERNEPRL